MVSRPVDIGAFEFAVLASLRVVQLRRGCTPRVSGTGTPEVMAQQEVAERKIARVPERNDGDATAKS